MNLYLIEQPEENVDYDTYDSAVVCAESEEEARKMHPSKNYDSKHPWWSNDNWHKDWANALEDVRVTLLGEAKEGLDRGVICRSFNAG